MEKPLSLPAKFLLIGAGGLAIVAGPILFLFPEQTETYFAWTIKHPLTPVFMGANYAGGIGAVWAMFTNRWSVARILLPGIFTFAITQLIATLLHIPVFNWSHPVAWAWLFVYVTSPLAAVWVYWSMEHDYQVLESRQPTLVPSFNLMTGALSLITGLIGAALILWPFLAGTQTMNSAVPWWAWALTPLTARIVGGWYLAASVLYAALRLENRLDRLKIGLFSLILVNGLQLIGILLHKDSLNGPISGVFLYLLISILSFGFSLYTWLRGSAISSAASEVSG